MLLYIIYFKISLFICIAGESNSTNNFPELLIHVPKNDLLFSPKHSKNLSILSNGQVIENSDKLYLV